MELKSLDEHSARAVSGYLLLFVIVMGVNLMPAFGPPTWTILVLYSLNTRLPTTAVVLVGASAAAFGRFLLASAFRFIGSKLSTRRRENLEAAKELIEQSKGKTLLALGLFVISPLPSAQLFEAAGLMRVRLVPFTIAFFAGRLISYFVYASTAAKVRETNIGDAFREAITEPIGIVVQLLVIAVLVVLTKVDWTRWLSRRELFTSLSRFRCTADARKAPPLGASAFADRMSPRAPGGNSPAAPSGSQDVRTSR